MPILPDAGPRAKGPPAGPCLNPEACLGSWEAGRIPGGEPGPRIMGPRLSEQTSTTTGLHPKHQLAPCSSQPLGQVRVPRPLRGSLPGATDAKHEAGPEHCWCPGDCSGEAPLLVGTRPRRAKRDSEGLGQLSPTEAWNRVHLLLHPALTLSGPEALGSG